MKNFYKKKSLGQNFLKNENILREIVDTAKISSGETILEIGPGEGNLTKELLSRGARVITVEKDDRLIPILEQKFRTEISTGKLVLIHSDILDFFLSNSNLTANNYKLIANIPYYITGEIIRRALSEWPQPSKIVLLVQKEVAKRIVANDKKESLLSISVKVYGTPKLVKIVKAGSFSPAPKVDSAIIAILDISKKFFELELSGTKKESFVNEKNFFEIVKTGFSHKRKKLAGNLKPLWGEKTEEKLFVCKIPKDSRAENLTIENWLCLAAR